MCLYKILFFVCLFVCFSVKGNASVNPNWKYSSGGTVAALIATALLPPNLSCDLGDLVLLARSGPRTRG